MKSSKLTFFVTMLTIIFSIQTASSQSIWLNDQSDFVSFEFAKPSINSFEPTILSASYNFGFGKPLSDKTMIIADVPIAYFNEENIESNTSLGNIYLGVRFGEATNNNSFEAGIYLPTGGSDEDNDVAALIGALSDLYRLESYVPDSWGVKLNYRREKSFGEKGGYYKLRLGSMFLNVNDEFLDESINILTLDYSAQIGVKTENGLSFMGGISGRGELSDEGLFSGDKKNALFLGLMLSYKTNNLEPGISLRAPLDESYNVILNNILALSLVYHL